MARDPPALNVLLDFDGTLVEPNVAMVLVREFAPDGDRVAREVDEALHAGEITLREAWRREVDLLRTDQVEEMTRYAVEHVPLRRGAHELLAYLAERDVPVTVVSGGLDFYIRAILDREHLALPIRCDTVTVRPDGGFELVHPFGHPTCRLCGICKANEVLRVSAPPYSSVFIGDGSTDQYAAEVAEVVFARRRLLDYCRRRGIACRPFDDFTTVLAEMRSWIDEGVPVPARGGRGIAESNCPISKEFAASEVAGRARPLAFETA